MDTRTTKRMKSSAPVTVKMARMSMSRNEHISSAVHKEKDDKQAAQSPTAGGRVRYGSVYPARPRDNWMSFNIWRALMKSFCFEFTFNLRLVAAPLIFLNGLLCMTLYRTRASAFANYIMTAVEWLGIDKEFLITLPTCAQKWTFLPSVP